MKRQNIYIYPLEGKTIFPYSEYRFLLKSSVYNAEDYDNLIGFVTKLEDGKDNKGVQKIDSFSRYGTLLRIHKVQTIYTYPAYDRLKDPMMNYLGLTFARFKILNLSKEENKIIASIEIYYDEITKDIQVLLEKKNLVQNLKKQLKTYYQCKLRGPQAQASKEKLESETSLNKIIYRSISDLEVSYAEKLKFLQLSRYDQRIEKLIFFLTEKTENSKAVISIEEKVRQQMNKSTPKKKPILSSLQSKQTNPFADKNELAQKIKNKKLPENVRVEIEKEMKNLGYGASKAVSQKYIETLLEIPWMECTEDVKDISIAEKILQDDHTGLKDVKQRILEYLSVKFRNGNSKGNIICLHGPPGVGKTSIAKSIAKALGRQFTRVSLGGMNDQSQLRGHRRTYVAALPGVIIRALMKAKSNNPVILLDQIEKIGKSYKGDPQHALLQILDPSQNNSFIDHYVGLPVDLSKVMFICTANSLELSRPLLNRLELIEVPGYSREQKLEIAKNHLIPLQVKENGVEGLASFDEGAIKQIIKYSRQLGVRQLQRNIAKVCRKIARKGAKQLVSEEKVEQYLGKKRKSQLWQGVGVVNGMAWTQMGGKVLTVEAIQYKSDKHKVQVTGQLGDVMKESVNIALSWLRSNFVEGSLQEYYRLQKVKFLDQVSIHIHFPEGAIKKDGPSAGVTIVTCLASLFLKMPPRENLSMTGQITLSGKVLPVGGVRQKCLAAIYEGIKHIIIPKANEKDIEKIDESIRRTVTFYPVQDLKQVLSIAFPSYLQKNTPKL